MNNIYHVCLCINATTYKARAWRKESRHSHISIWMSWVVKLVLKGGTASKLGTINISGFPKTPIAHLFNSPKISFSPNLKHFTWPTLRGQFINLLFINLYLYIFIFVYIYIYWYLLNLYYLFIIIINAKNIPFTYIVPHIDPG